MVVENKRLKNITKRIENKLKRQKEKDIGMDNFEKKIR